MKHLNRNTLVRDFIGAAFCLVMAFALLMMYSGCSEDACLSQVAYDGGYTEEQGVYALAGQAGDVYPKLLKSAEEGKDPKDSLKNEGSVFVSKGTIVSVYELDSLTLDTTGRFFVDTVDNDSGRFAFDNLTLNSPYVLIETLDSCYQKDCLDRGMLFGGQTKTGYDLPSYCSDSLLAESEGCSKKYLNVLSSVVNLRNVKKVRVSTLTTSKIPLLKKYFAEGKSFAEASGLAEQEILEKLGIYENLGAFEDLSRNDSELSYVNELFRLDDFDIRFDVGRVDVPIYFAPSKAFSIRGLAVEQYYLNSMKMIEYKIGYLARQDSLGRCTEVRENETGTVKDAHGHDIAVVCRSGKWTIGFKSIEHAKGTMTDNRDGKKYRTVTYNFGGNTQTWMAENLDFADAADTCYRFKLDNGNCEAYGRAYRWNMAMDIESDDIKPYSVGTQGDTLFMSKRCLDAYIDESNWISLLVEKYDEAVVDSCNAALYGSDSLESERGSVRWTWNYEDFITSSNQSSYQGVCPDGWRIPTFGDWKTLLQNLGEQYGVPYGSVVPVLYDDVATGFNMKSHVLAVADSFHVLLRDIGFHNRFVVADARVYEVDFFVQWILGEGFDLNFSSTWHAIIDLDEKMEENSELLQRNFTYSYQNDAVRCVKN